MAKDRSWKEYAAWIVGGMALLSWCGGTIDNMSATGKGTVVAGAGAAAAGGAAGYGCSKVGLKTCLGGGGGGGGSKKPATEDTTPATTPQTAPPATTPPTAPPVTLIPRPPTPTPNTTPGGLHLPDGVTLDRTGMDAGPGIDLTPCIVGGVGQIGMSQC